MDRTGYAPVNGLDMYYEVHGAGAPLVLVHGALSGIGTSFGAVLPMLAKDHQVIAVELQAHGRTADIDRPLTVPQLAADVVGVLDHLGIDRADVFGYSLGAAIALQLGTAHPDRVDRLVLASVSYQVDGMHPGLLDGIAQLQPEHLFGSPFHEEYLGVAPDPEAFASLVAKVKELDSDLPEWSAAAVQALEAPTMVVAGDSDIIRPEHAVEMFRLLGGGVVGDMVGLPRCRLAILPGTTHTSLTGRADWLASMVEEFLTRTA
jgi:pimeloyl-ACP methyl ester carboxylesterase